MQISREQGAVLLATLALLSITALAVIHPPDTRYSAWHDGETWVVKDQPDGDYHRYLPEIDQVVFQGNAGRYSISTERYMVVTCTDSLALFLGDIVSYYATGSWTAGRFGVGVGYKDPITIHPYDDSMKATYRKVAPERVRCIITFKDKRFERVYKVNVHNGTIVHRSQNR